MVTNELLTFIKTERAKGFPDVAIKTLLCEHSWLPSDVDEAFRAVGLVNEPVSDMPVAPKKMHGCLFVLVAIGAIVSLGYLGLRLSLPFALPFLIPVAIFIAVVFYNKVNNIGKNAGSQHMGIRALSIFLAVIGAIGVILIGIFFFLAFTGQIRIGF